MRRLSSATFLTSRFAMTQSNWKQTLTSPLPRLSHQSHSHREILFSSSKSYLTPNLLNLLTNFSSNQQYYAHFSSQSNDAGKEHQLEDMQVEIISKENIKPASPTPDHLRTYEVSILDQLFPNVYMPFVYFYKNNHDQNQDDKIISERRQLLKLSLSENLTKFYPLAGKIKDSRHIDCNDDGVYYVEAKVNHQLSDFLKQPSNRSIHQFLPVDPNSVELLFTKTDLVMIQVTVFDCGGIAIGVYTSHKIIDGYSHGTFFKAWAAAAARGSSNSKIKEIISPSFISPSIFPSNPALPENTTMLSLPKFSNLGKSVTKRFLFGSSSIVNLKKKAGALTRAIAVMGIIWKCIMAAASKTNKKKDITSNNYCDPRPFVLMIPINLRNKSSPPMPSYLIGNIIWSTTLTHFRSDDDDDLELDSIARRLKNAIDEINNDFIEQMKGEEWSLKFGQQLNELEKFYPHENVVCTCVTSMCNSGIYEADFGWGMPIWASVGNADANIPLIGNLVFLMDTRFGNGVEAWVTLSEEEMAVVENDQELLTFASVDPSPLETDHD